MNVYWRYVRRGQNLILANEEGQEERIGGFRELRRGIDAYATTFGYDPGRSQKGFPSAEDAKAFVESFRPWELYCWQPAKVGYFCNEEIRGMWQRCWTPGAAGCSVDAIVKSELSPPVS